MELRSVLVMLLRINAVVEVPEFGTEICSANSAAGADNAGEEALKSDTESGHSYSYTDNTVQETSEKGAGRRDVASVAGNSVQVALNNDTVQLRSLWKI